MGGGGGGSWVLRDLSRCEGDLDLRVMRAQVHLQSLCSEAEGEDARLVGRLSKEERSEERGCRNRDLSTLPGRDAGGPGFTLRWRRLRLSPEIARSSVCVFLTKWRSVSCV